MRRVISTGLACLLTAAIATAATSEDLELICKIGTDGAGHEQGVAAAARLAELPAGQVLDVLAVMDQASPVGKNWLRAIAEDVADNGPLPQGPLVQFIQDRSGPRESRYVAFLLLRDEDPKQATSLLDDMLDDPSQQLRYEAVAKVMQQAKELDGAEATAAYQSCLDVALHPNQLTEIAKALRDAGQEVDLAKHMGFLTGWKLVASFDNTDKQGYDTAFAPEKDYLASEGLSGEKTTYTGKDGNVSWQDYQSDDDLGLIDLNPVYSNDKSAICYAYKVISSTCRDLLKCDSDASTPTRFGSTVNS